jgi:predicted RND superfamily exporter protein
MNRLFDALRPFIRWVVRRAGLVFALGVVLSIGACVLASNLRIDPDLANLLPEDYRSVQSLDKLRATVGGGNNAAAVAVVSPSFEANKRFAETIIPKVLDLQREDMEAPFFRRVRYYRDTRFMRNNALYFATNEELAKVETYLDEQIDEAKLEANPFYVDVEGESDSAAVDTTARDLQVLYERIVGQEYPISDDSTTMVLRFFPSGGRSDIGFIENAYEDLEKTVNQINLDRFHPEMKVVLAGELLRQLVEIQTIQQDVFSSFGAGVATVLLFVMLYFLYKAYRARAGGRFSSRILSQELLRAPVMAFVIGLPLLMSLLWTGAAAYLAFTDLNVMTATLGLVLFGLGIDFGIHFYARYTEERGEGSSVAEAMETTFAGTGQAITIGVLTTASALFVLMMADFKGFSEFGFIAGVGVLLALIAMTVVMPALLALFERTGLLNLEAAAASPNLERTQGRFPAARGLVVASLAAVAVAVVMLPPQFEYEFGNLEPTYTEYNKKRNVVRRVWGRTASGKRKRNPAYIVAKNRRHLRALKDSLNRRMRSDTTSSTILMVETLQERFPLRKERQQDKLQRISKLRTKLATNKYLRQDSSKWMMRLRRASQTDSAVTRGQVPEFLKKQFVTKSGELGNFVIVYPSVGLSDARKSMAFSEDVSRIAVGDTTYTAGSTSLVAADMVSLMLAEAPWMVAFTFLIVALLMWVNFRSVKWAALAILPLVVGVLWMLLVIELFDIKLNFYNLVVLPAVLGIGNDAGVHIVHRYREEGAGSILQTLRSTGEHVAMGSLTTIIGFGGLLLSFHPGLHSIGLLAVIGIGTTLVAALVFLPALLQWVEDRSEASPEPRKEAAA